MMHPEYQSILEKRLFFITGRGRSGTWLLQSILDTHPEVSVAPEALFVIHLYRKYRKVTDWTVQLKQAFIKDLLTEKKMAIWWGTEAETISLLLGKYPPETSFSALCKAIYYDYACRNNKADAKLFGDKNPEYSLHIPALVELFPEVRFVHLIRDPRANILSYQKVSFDMNNPAALAYRWKLYNQDIQVLQTRFPDRILILKYEDLLLDTASVLRKICAFLNIDFTEKLLDFHQSSKKTFSWNRKIAEPIDTDRVNTWQKEISPKTEAVVFSICGKLAQEFGYTSEVKAKLPLGYLPGLWMGKLTGFLEKLLFRLPLRWRVFILDAYRKRVEVLGEV